MSIASKIATLQARCEGVAGIRSVVTRKRDFNPDDLPAIAIYRGQSQVADQVPGSKTLLRVPLVVEYHKAAGDDDPAAQAEAMIDAVLAVVEVDGWSDCDLFVHAGDGVTLPPDDGGTVSVQVFFEADIIRQYGGASA
jgi:hypothetical protein